MMDVIREPRTRMLAGSASASCSNIAKGAFVLIDEVSPAHVAFVGPADQVIQFDHFATVGD